MNTHWISVDRAQLKKISGSTLKFREFSLDLIDSHWSEFRMYRFSLIENDDTADELNEADALH